MTKDLADVYKDIIDDLDVARERIESARSSAANIDDMDAYHYLNDLRDAVWEYRESVRRYRQDLEEEQVMSKIDTAFHGRWEE